MSQIFGGNNMIFLAYRNISYIYNYIWQAILKFYLL